MKHPERNTLRRPIGKLPLFPTPYPGESLYSILCRYHVRIGNASAWYTAGQLFGYNSSLGSTLLSPYHLDKVRFWFAPGTPVTAELLMQYHTAFPLYALTAWRDDLLRMRRMISGETRSTTYPRWVQSRLVHQSGFLRYCPECYAVQKKLYGEGYWQILPQVDGVEYCPVHGTRIRDSRVPQKSIRHMFIPASEALEIPSYAAQSMEEARRTEHSGEEKEFFILLARGMDWLQQNGSSYEGCQVLYGNYNKLLENENGTFYPTISIKKLREFLVPHLGEASFQKYTMIKLHPLLTDRAIFLYSFPLCVHVMLMIVLSGSPELFYAQ